MNFWEKLMTDPELGHRGGSPLARVALGLGLLLDEASEPVRPAFPVRMLLQGGATRRGWRKCPGLPLHPLI